MALPMRFQAIFEHIHYRFCLNSLIEVEEKRTDVQGKLPVQIVYLAFSSFNFSSSPSSETVVAPRFPSRKPIAAPSARPINKNANSIGQ